MQHLLEARVGLAPAMSGMLAPTGSEIFQSGEFTTPSLTRRVAGWKITLFGTLLTDESDPVGVIRRAIADGPDEAFGKLNGSYSFAALHESSGTAYVAVDRMATKPIYYKCTTNGFEFSSDLQSFKGGTLNKSALASVLGTGYVNDEDTWVNGVKYLRGGHYLYVDQKGSRVHQYWTHRARREDMAEEEARPRLRELLLQAVERRTRGTGVGLLLSGGYDSRAILGACMELGRTVTLLSYGANMHPGDDPSIAGQLAAISGMPFHVLHYDQLTINEAVRRTTNPFAAMRYPIQEVTGLESMPDNIRTVLMGDEIFGWGIQPMQHKHEALYSFRINRLQSIPAWKELIAPEAYETLCEHNRKTHERLIDRGEPWYGPAELRYHLAVTEAHPRNLMLGRLFISQLAEVANPWLDSDIMDFMSSVPLRMLSKKSLFTHTAEEMFPALFRVEAGNSRLSGVRPSIVGYKHNSRKALRGIFDNERLHTYLKARPTVSNFLLTKVLGIQNMRVRDYLKRLAFNVLFARCSTLRRTRAAATVTATDLVTRMAMAQYAVEDCLQLSE